MKLAALLLLSASAIAVTLEGTLLSNEILSAENLPLSSRIELDHGVKQAWFQADGTFEFYDVHPGLHVVKPMIPGYAAQAMLITIPSTPDTAPHVQAFYPNRAPLNTSTPSLSYPVQLMASSAENYYTAAPGMNMLQMLKSPMVLLMLFSSGMAIALPKLTAALDDDPDMAAEVADTRKRMGSNMDWSQQLSGILADGGARGTGSTPPEVPAVKAAAGVSAGRGGRGGKRGGGKR